MLQINKSMTVKGLCAALYVSPATVRRDPDALEWAGHSIFFYDASKEEHRYSFTVTPPIASPPSSGRERAKSVPYAMVSSILRVTSQSSFSPRVHAA